MSTDPFSHVSKHSHRNQATFLHRTRYVCGNVWIPSGLLFTVAGDSVARRHTCTHPTKVTVYPMATAGGSWTVVPVSFMVSWTTLAYRGTSRTLLPAWRSRTPRSCREPPPSTSMEPFKMAKRVALWIRRTVLPSSEFLLLAEWLPVKFAVNNTERSVSMEKALLPCR